jgi:hypothetical protein
MDAKEQESAIWRSAFGVMFMAVPHRGSPIADYATLLTNVAKVVGPLSKEKLKQLKTHSETLMDLSTRFGNIQKHLRLISVRESESTLLWPQLGKGSVLVIFASSELRLYRILIIL